MSAAAGRRPPLLRVFRDPVPGGAAVDTAVSRALLDGACDGESRDCLRLWRPAAALAFSAIDRTRPGFAAAVQVARDAGFEPFLRLAGGHAAAYAPSLLAFAWARKTDDARGGIAQRFADLSSRVVSALAAFGVDARVGAVPGEFCPGDYSVNARGAVKLMGVGQRVVRGGVHMGGVLQVEKDPGVRDVLERVYAALELDFAPETFGSVVAECAEASHTAVADALLAQFARDHTLEFAALSADVVAQAAGLAPRHQITASAVPAPGAARTNPPGE